MNLYTMRNEFGKLHRTNEDSAFEAYRDGWLNNSWLRVSEMFVIPALRRDAAIDSVVSQSDYLFPYDYGGTEVTLKYKTLTTGSSKRLDPVDRATLELMFERRSGTMGSVLYYDATACVGSDLLVTACTLVNGSATVVCAGALAIHVGHWVRFDPVTVGTVTTDPGDYGYRVLSAVVGVSLTLDRVYRGPSVVTVVRVRPAEQQQFKVFGTPTVAITGAFSLTYYSKPRRLYNDADVPEWPSAGWAVVHLAVAMGYDYLHDSSNAAVWFGRAMSTLTSIQRRQKYSQTLVSDLHIGSVTGRQTGPRPVFLR